MLPPTYIACIFKSYFLIFLQQIRDDGQHQVRMWKTFYYYDVQDECLSPAREIFENTDVINNVLYRN